MTIPGPIGGNFTRLAAFHRDPLSFFQALTRTWGPDVRFRMGPWTFFLINSPERAGWILSHHRPYFHKGPGLDPKNPLIGGGLLTSEDETWIHQRRSLAPVFRRDNVSRMQSELMDVIQDDLAEWPLDIPFDLEPRLLRLSLTMAVRTLFADKSSTTTALKEVGHQVEWLMAHFYHRSRSVWRFPYQIPPFNRRYHAHATRLHQFTESLKPIARPFETVWPHLSSDPNALLQEAATLIIAGYETTGHAMAWALDLLASHPDVHQHVYQESLTDDVDKPWTRAVLNESLRLFPPVWLLSRRATQDIPNEDLLIPNGSIVLISPWLMHRNPDVFPHPDDFRPERWINAAPIPPYHYIPFGAGPRGCIGEHLALEEAVLAISTIVRHLQLTTQAGPREVFPGLTLAAKEPLWVTAKRRRAHPV